MDKIAVVILNWNGCDMLRSFLPSVVRFSEADGAVVYVADNGSTDASVAMLRREFPSVHLILLEENHGFADGYNLALKQVEAEYVVLLNSDVEVTEHWLVPLAEYMDAYPETAACQPKIRSWRQKEWFEYAGAAGGFIDRYGYPFCRGRVMGVVEADRGQYDTVLPIFWATGAAMFIRLADYREAGRTLLCPHGRDRSLLETPCPRTWNCLHPPKCGLSCRRSYVEEGESAQDLPQFS
jgi:GT2 family glycosyltransferase